MGERHDDMRAALGFSCLTLETLRLEDIMLLQLPGLLFVYVGSCNLQSCLFYVYIVCDA